MSSTNSFEVQPGWWFPINEAFDVYRMYVGLKLHFGNLKYNWLESEGHVVNTTKDSFRRRNDRMCFRALLKKHPEAREIYFYLLANFSRNPSFWIGEQEAGEATYNEWKSSMNNIGAMISTDINFMVEESYNNGLKTFLESITITADKPHPLFVQWVLGGKISLETATVLANGLPILSLWAKSQPELMKHDLILHPIALQLRKYGMFFDVKRHIEEHNHELRQLLSFNQTAAG